MKDTDLRIGNAADVLHWHLGQRIELHMNGDGSLRPLTRREQLMARLRRFRRRYTRWFRPRTVVTRTDAANGIISIGTERWSWRHWRWERS